MLNMQLGGGVFGCELHISSDIQILVYINPCSNLPIGALVLIGLTIFLRLRGAPNKDRALPFTTKISNMDPLGCLVFVGAACCLLLVLQWGGQTKPWNSPDVIGCLVGSVAIAALFILLQWRRGDRALIPFRVFKKRSIWTGAMVLFFLGAQTYIVSLLSIMFSHPCLRCSIHRVRRFAQYYS